VIAGLAGAYLRQVKRAPRGGRAGFAGRGVASGGRDGMGRGEGAQGEGRRGAFGGGACAAARQRVPARSALASLSSPPRWLPSE
jgi:hypothetical protein